MPRDEMPNELEAFLRRAADIRKRNAIEFREQEAEQRRQKAGPRPRAYSDRNRERVTRQLAEAMDAALQDDDDIVMGQIVEDDSQTMDNPEYDSEAEFRKVRQPLDKPTLDRVATPAENLRHLLTQPGGIQQAFLMAEILNRRKF